MVLAATPGEMDQPTSGRGGGTLRLRAVRVSGGAEHAGRAVCCYS
jgi:hypothetical protein